MVLEIKSRLSPRDNTTKGNLTSRKMQLGNRPFGKVVKGGFPLAKYFEYNRQHYVNSQAFQLQGDLTELKIIQG